MTDRKKRIDAFCRDVLPDQFNKSCPEIVGWCEEHCQEMVSELLDALKIVTGKVKTLQQSGKKGKIKYLVFSHLYTGMILGHKRIRIDAMDQGLYGDITDTEAYLDMEGIYQFLAADLEAIKEELRRSIPQILEYEIERIRYEYMMRYQGMAKAFIKAILEEVDSALLLAEINCEAQVTVLFGGYMDHADVILKLKGGGR